MNPFKGTKLHVCTYFAEGIFREFFKIRGSSTFWQLEKGVNNKCYSLADEELVQNQK